MNDNDFWVRIWLTVCGAIVCGIALGVVHNLAQEHIMVTAGYCERVNTSGWIRCDLMKDVVMR